MKLKIRLKNILLLANKSKGRSRKKRQKKKKEKKKKRRDRFVDVWVSLLGMQAQQTGSTLYPHLNHSVDFGCILMALIPDISSCEP